MSEPDYYEILGVSRSATADEIRSAYREHVKRYHPDIYSTPEDKARATDQFQRINEAYEVLGDPERRRAYDQKRAARVARPVSSSAPRRRGQRTRQSRPKPANRPKPAKRRTPRVPRFRGWIKPGAVVVGLMIAGLLTYASLYEREPVAVWTLFEQTVVESAGPADAGQVIERNWNRLAQYPSKADCAEGLKALVRRDEQTGSKALVDEKHGTTGMTVRLENKGSSGSGRDAAAQPNPFGRFDSLQNDTSAKRREENPAGSGQTIKRVRTFECRESRYLPPEPWLARFLRRAGLIS